MLDLYEETLSCIMYCILSANRDNYGFVTFLHTDAAYSAIESKSTTAAVSSSLFCTVNCYLH